MALTFAGLVGGYLGSLVLKRLRRPLDAVIGQAQAISQRRFVTIEEPKVPELRQLAVAMNATVGRLKSMFDEEAARLELVRRQANYDELTGLHNRPSFLAGLQQSLDAEFAAGGTLVLIRLVDLAGINQRLGRSATDEYLRRAGLAIGECITSSDQGLAARLNGSDFSLLLGSDLDARGLAEALLQKLTQLGAPFVQTGAAAWVVLGHFDKGSEMQEVLARVDLTLAAAQSDGGSSVCEAPSGAETNSPRTADQWLITIRQALENGWVRLVGFPVVDMAGRLLHSEHMLRIKFEEHGEWQPAGHFLPVAERLQLTAQIDLVSVSLGLKVLAADRTLPGLALNLSGGSIGNRQFCEQLLSLLDAQPELAHRLWLEVAEVGALKYLEAFRNLCIRLKTRGCRIGLEHFGHQFDQIGLLHDLGLDYLKVDSSFVHDVDTNPGNAAFLKGLCSITHTIGFQVFAEGVASQSELQALESLGFDGVTGPAIAR
jgi:EAL domain-containing protein (putative c-di-GMP-specific phosphodiesterase class I)/GGDEF domain-containing protein